MAKKTDKYLQKREQLVERTSLALSVTQAEAEELLRIERRQAVRLNTLRAPADELLQSLGSTDASLRQVSWTSEGYFVDSGLASIRDSQLNEEGSIYIQNAASWLPVLALNPQAGEYILDVCAAPGGKTSHIAQKSNNQAFITANDNSRPRLHKLQRNLERLGVTNVEFTLHDATRLASILKPESFDKILLDAPCSGEGMMTIDSRKDFESWSVAHIKRLQQLQKKLIVQAWKLLKPGGTLVYSTCTMAPEENEAVVEYLLRHNDDVRIESLQDIQSQIPSAVTPVLEWNDKQYNEVLQGALRLKPSTDIEAFFVVKLTKAFEA